METPETLFKCYICERDFLLKAHMRSHFTVAHGKRIGSGIHYHKRLSTALSQPDAFIVGLDSLEGELFLNTLNTPQAMRASATTS